LLGASLPQRPIEIAGGLIFIVFGLLALRPGDDDADDQPRSMVRSSVVATIGLAIFVVPEAHRIGTQSDTPPATDGHRR
jgi:putative Ca2+/H+ antiporter (TMEM165/GDT1 family)